MRESVLEKFERVRREQNSIVMDYADRELKRFYSLDASVYEENSLPSKTKELIGLVTSIVLRCDDCIKYHLIQLFNIGITDDELIEAMTVCMVVGGSITIPHIRRALVFWDKINQESLQRMKKELAFGKLERKIDDVLISKKSDFNDILQRICRILWKNVDHYDWVGFYMTGDKPDLLELGPFTGAETEHTEIPFGKGICGQAAAKKETVIVQDVSKIENYLSCSIAVQSEIVAPIIKDGKVIGELDIDSHSIEPFTEADKVFLEKIAEKVAKIK
ncbi:MAG: carboxymuconolactone decarboxylase family protein [Candidatus Zixiibacteriota bacterium]